MRIIDELSKDRLMEIRFDTGNRQVVLICSTLFSAPRQKSIPFENARLEIAESKTGWTWLGEPLTFYFLKSKTEVFEIKRSKDGFSVGKLKEIAQTIETLSVPVVRV